MKRTLIFGVVLLVLVSFLGVTSSRALERSSEDEEDIEAQPDETANAQMFQAAQYKTLDDFMKGVIPPFMTSHNGVGMAIGVIQNKQPKAYYFGEIAKGSGQKPNGSTLFMIGSISKTFTATLLALYAENKPGHPPLVNLGDPLQQYVPSGVTVPFYNNDSSHPITLQTLATHTSGLPRLPPIPRGPGGVTPEQLFTSLNNVTLGSEPGSKYLYSNYAFSLLGQALARVENKTWPQLNLQEIDSPLGLTDTKVELQLDSGEMNRRAQGYDANGNPIASYTMPGFPAGSPAGGLFSTVDDMTKYLSYIMGLTSTSLNSLRPMLTTPLHPSGPGGKVALAWQINPLKGTSYNAVWKNGAVKGFESYIGYVPETGDGVVLLLNFHTNKQQGALGQAILSYLVQPAPISPNQLQIQKSNPTLQNRGPAGPGPVENQKNLRQGQ